MSTVSEGTPKRKAKKRADGEGSLRWSEAKKLWIGRVMVGYRPDGKPDVREVTAKRQDECRKKLEALKAQAASGTLVDATRGRETVAAFMTVWLESIAGTMEPASLARHQDNVRRHIGPGIGRHKLTDLRPEHLVALFATLRTERPAPKLPTDDAPRGRRASKKRPTTLPPLSARSVKYVFTTIRLALDAAVRWGAVPRNVARVIDAPKVPRPEIKALSPVEVATFLDAVSAAGDRLAPLYEVAVLSGCRLGELLALRWSDVSDAGVISINRTLTATSGGAPVFADPKTQRSRRSFRLSSDAMAALVVQRDRQSFERQALGDAYRDFGLVFATPLGTPLDSDNALKRFRAALKAAGIAHRYTFHSLRHTAATTMLEARIDAKVVADRLGHSSPAFTLERYAHAVPALDDDAADRLQNVIRSARRRVV
jgi:integrase